MEKDNKVWSISIWSKDELVGILEFDRIRKYNEMYIIEYYNKTVMILPLTSIKGKLKKSYGCDGKLSKGGYDIRGYKLNV